MSVEKILEVKDVHHFCTELAKKPEIITENDFLYKFLNFCYRHSAGCRCKKSDNIKSHEESFMSLYNNLEEEQRKIFSKFFDGSFNSIYLKFSDGTKLDIR